MSNQRILYKKVETDELLTTALSSWLDDEPVLANAGDCWSDILKVEHCQLPPTETPEVIYQEHVLYLHLKSHPITLEWQLNDERPMHKLIEPGDLHLNTQGVKLWGRWHQEIEVLVVSLNPGFVARVAQDTVDADRIEFTNPHAFQDTQLQHLMLALKAELNAGCPGGRLYGEALGTALTLHIMNKYGVSQPTVCNYKGGLSQQQLKQVFDYIQDHLDQEISLDILAAQIGMSQFYFARLFKQSVGMSPYRYLIGQRIERAKQLLRQKDLSITDIALRCGFNTQSHLTQYFRQLTSTTPKKYRSNL